MTHVNRAWFVLRILVEISRVGLRETFGTLLDVSIHESVQVHIPVCLFVLAFFISDVLTLWYFPDKAGKQLTHVYGHGDQTKQHGCERWPESSCLFCFATRVSER